MAMRSAAAAGVLVSGLVHLWLWWYEGFRLIPSIGPLFLLNAVAGVLIAAILVTWRSWVPALLAVGFGLTTLGAFLLSATVGLLGLHEILLGTPQIVCMVAEVVAVVAGGVVLVREWPSGMRLLPGRALERSAGEPQDGLAARRTDLD